jgi:hypothetical protein
MLKIVESVRKHYSCNLLGEVARFAPQCTVCSSWSLHLSLDFISPCQGASMNYVKLFVL